MSALSGVQQITTYLQNGLSFDVTGVQTPLGKGVSVPPICNFTMIPKAIDAAYIVAAGQTLTNGVPLTLVTARSTTFNGEQVVVLDCARKVSVTASAGLTNATTFVVKGYDINFKQLTSQFTINAAGTTGSTPSCFLLVSSITPTFANTNAQTVSAGTTDVIGLPFFLPHLSDINSIFWNETALTVNTTNITVGNLWRTAGSLSAISTDANGFITLPNASNDAKILRVSYYCYGADSAFNAVLANQVFAAFPYAIINGTTVTQISDWALTYAYIQRNQSNTSWVYATLLDQDLIGPRYPIDDAFMTGYRNALDA